MGKLRNIFLSFLPSIWDLCLWLENASKISAINDHILIKGYDANYDDFSIFIKWEQCFQIKV